MINIDFVDYHFADGYGYGYGDGDGRGGYD